MSASSTMPSHLLACSDFTYNYILLRVGNRIVSKTLGHLMITGKVSLIDGENM